MNEPLEINGKLFVPVRQAADRFSYSRDHITRLAKANKINATQFGRFWFVQEQSLENYLADQQFEASARKQILSRQRQAELAVRAALANADTNQQTPLRHSGVLAVALTSTLLLLGVVVASQIVPASSGSLAGVLSATTPAQPVVTVTSTSDAIQPVFSDSPRVVVTDSERVVDKPAVTPQWVRITP